MRYISTRGNAAGVSASQAIISGLAPDGGLYLPDAMPRVSGGDVFALCKMDYPHRAAFILKLFLDEFSDDELERYTSAAYSVDRFGGVTAPVVNLGGSEHILELFHGPTCAFKDFALQLLPHLLTGSLRKNGVTNDVVILVATSGDTGKAALEGFADVDGTRICVFYPYGGTSNIQRLQMTTQAGGNVLVTAVRGNFDDAQTGVKRIFSDAAYSSELSAHGLQLSSANSINWGRLAPQVAYYFSAYCDLVNGGEISIGDSINVTVPTGNFGNILAAYIAKLCGLPIRKFICASNSNNVLTDFLTTGVYDRNRPFFMTTSPSMDILVSSNLERLLYLVTGNSEAVAGHMRALSECGRYDVGANVLSALRADFDCGFADDRMAAAAIAEVFASRHYLMDPHTAVAHSVYEQYAARTGDSTPTVVASTASPFKFPASVLFALGQGCDKDDFAMIDRVAALCGLQAPARLAALSGMQERFTEVIDPADMRAFVSRFMG